ncbi:hypothetical protein [Haloarcula sediminis]|uniref:hypothetical protein n=1 Tax=Haloarcula sediminis TaxID=3111777 RepID=UPI002D76E3FD|nr:hypothetical protein [Haloarcula sp. CK38]
MGNRTNTPHMSGEDSEDSDDSTESQDKPVTDGGTQAVGEQAMQDNELEERLVDFLRFVARQAPDKEAVKEAHIALDESLREVAEEQDLTDFEAVLALYALILDIENEYRKESDE